MGFAKGISIRDKIWVSGNVQNNSIDGVEVYDTSICEYTNADYDGNPIFDKDLIAIYSESTNKLVSLIQVYKSKSVNMYFLRYLIGDAETINKELNFHLIPDLELEEFFKWLKDEKGGADIRILGSIIRTEMYLN